MVPPNEIKPNDRKSNDRKSNDRKSNDRKSNDRKSNDRQPNDRKKNISDSKKHSYTHRSHASPKKTRDKKNTVRTRSSSKQSSSRYKKTRVNQPRKEEKKWTHQLSTHFTTKEFACKESGKLKISLGLIGALELLRARLRKRVHILKGYESVDVAEKRGAGKLTRNFHTQGLAADIRVDNLTVTDTFKFAEAIPEFKGIGLNINENYVHVDTRKSDRYLWIEENDQEIELTDKNKHRYFELPTST